MITNLFSLLSTNWFIEPTMKNSLLPLLQNVMDGKLVQGSSIYPSIYTSSTTLAGDKDSPTPTSNDNYVAVIPIKGGIYKYNQFCGPTGTQTHGKQIRAYDRDINCIGIVLDIDSGGGQVSGTAELYDIIRSISTPVETYTDGYLCSAAYYIASATKQITANKRADKIGSIGAMTYFIDLKGYYEAMGAQVIEVNATKSVDKNRAVKELIEGDPNSWIKEELDPIVEDFIIDVKNQRKSIKEEVFTGGTYSPNTAINMGLIDKLGNLNEVINSLLSTKKDNQEKNTNMSKTIALAGITAALGVESLVITDKGSYLNEEQLSTLNAALTSISDKEKELSTQLENSQNSVTQMETQLSDLLTIASVENTGDTTADFTALSEKITELNSKPANAHTSAQGNTAPPADQKEEIVDMEASHNQLANSIFN